LLGAPRVQRQRLARRGHKDLREYKVHPTGIEIETGTETAREKRLEKLRPRRVQ